MGVACCRSAKVGIEDPLPPGVVLVGKELEQEAIRVGSRAFCGTASTDPEFVLDWVLGPRFRGLWEDEGRQKFFRWLWNFLVVTSLRKGGIGLGATKEDGSLGAVCLLQPYLKRRRPPGALTEMAQYMWHYRELGLPPVDKGGEKRMDRLTKLMYQMHKKHAPGDHWYVVAMAVDPSGQGQGLCGKLMRFASVLADRNGVPCYLETAGRRNVAIYNRFGYQEVGQYTVSAPSDPDKAPPFEECFAMVRPPSRQTKAWTE